MTSFFIICNQHDQILEKSGDWGYGDDNRSVYRTLHKDEAINQIVELTVKNPELRARITDVETTEKGQLVLPEPPADRLPIASKNKAATEQSEASIATITPEEPATAVEPANEPQLSTPQQALV